MTLTVKDATGLNELPKQDPIKQLSIVISHLLVIPNSLLRYPKLFTWEIKFRKTDCSNKNQVGNILQYVEFHTLTFILEHTIFYS